MPMDTVFSYHLLPASLRVRPHHTPPVTYHTAPKVTLSSHSFFVLSFILLLPLPSVSPLPSSLSPSLLLLDAVPLLPSSSLSLSLSFPHSFPIDPAPGQPNLIVPLQTASSSDFIHRLLTACNHGKPSFIGMETLCRSPVVLCQAPGRRSDPPGSDAAGRPCLLFGRYLEA